MNNNKKDILPTNNELPAQFKLSHMNLILRDRFTRASYENPNEEAQYIYCKLCHDIIRDPSCCKKCKAPFCTKCFDQF